MRPGPGALKRRLHEILRVDHAGELGAVWIYRGQKAVFDAAPGKQKITDDLAELALACCDGQLGDRRIQFNGSACTVVAAAAGYPAKADPTRMNKWGMFGVLFVFVLAATALWMLRA